MLSYQPSEAYQTVVLNAFAIIAVSLPSFGYAGQVKTILLSAVQRIEAQIALTREPADSTAVSAPAGHDTRPHESPSPSGLGKSIVTAIRDASLSVSSKFSALALAIHVILLELGFVCNGSDSADRSLPGFAAPARGDVALVDAVWQS